MKALISDYYRDQNTELHQLAGYGSSGHLWLGHVLEIAEAVNASSILDYGAGKGTLGRYLTKLGYEYTPYDPVTFPTIPTDRFDLVVSLDVLEHIEPTKLDAVLDHMADLTKTAFFCNVCTRPSSKTLSDGRNAHLIAKDWYWWKGHLKGNSRFRVARIRQHIDSFEFVGYRLAGNMSDQMRKQLQTGIP